MVQRGLQRGEVSLNSLYLSACEKKHSAEPECHDFRCYLTEHFKRIPDVMSYALMSCLCPLQNGHISALKLLLNTAFLQFIRPCQSEGQVLTIGERKSLPVICPFVFMNAASQIFHTFLDSSSKQCMWLLSTFASLCFPPLHLSF